MRFAGPDVDLVVPCAVVRDPLHARCDGVNELLVKDADAVGGVVVSVDADDVVILIAGRERSEELSSVSAVHGLCWTFLRINSFEGDVENSRRPLRFRQRAGPSRRVPSGYRLRRVGNKTYKMKIKFTADEDPG